MVITYWIIRWNKGYSRILPLVLSTINENSVRTGSWEFNPQCNLIVCLIIVCGNTTWSTSISCVHNRLQLITRTSVNEKANVHYQKKSNSMFFLIQMQIQRFVDIATFWGNATPEGSIKSLLTKLLQSGFWPAELGNAIINERKGRLLRFHQWLKIQYVYLSTYWTVQSCFITKW